MRPSVCKGLGSMRKVFEYDTFNCKHCSIDSTDYDGPKKSQNIVVYFVEIGKLDISKTLKKGIKNNLFCWYCHTEPTRLNAMTSNVSVMLIRVGLMLRVVYFSGPILAQVIGKEAIIFDKVATLVDWFSTKSMNFKTTKGDPWGTLSVDDDYNVRLLIRALDNKSTTVIPRVIVAIFRDGFFGNVHHIVARILKNMTS